MTPRPAIKVFTFYVKSRKTFYVLRKILPALLAFSWAGCSAEKPQAPELGTGQDFSIFAEMSAQQIRIGDPVELTLAVLHRDGVTVSFPKLANGKEIVVREATIETTTAANGVHRTAQKTRLTSLTVTNLIIGEKAVIVVSTPTGVTSNPVPFLSLEVATSLRPGEQEIRPTKGGLAQWPAPASRWVWVALGVLLALVAAFFALRKFLLTPRTILHMAPPIPPHVVALAALEQLRKKGWIEALRIEPFYVALSGIVRVYLEGRFGLRAPERTTEEFIRDALSSPTLSESHRDLVSEFLTQSDLVKFARLAPGPDDMRHALDSAERLVQETRAGGGAP